MKKDTAQTVVKIIAVLFWVGAVLSFISGIAMLVGGAIFGALVPGIGALGGLAIAMGVVALILAILDAVVGLGLWKFKRWAWIIAVILSVLSLFSFPLGTVVGIVFLILLAGVKDIRSLFK